jgi:hypothetical protein
MVWCLYIYLADGLNSLLLEFRKGVIAVSDRDINSCPTGLPEKSPIERRTLEVDFPGEGKWALWSKDEI